MIGNREFAKFRKAICYHTGTHVALCPMPYVLRSNRRGGVGDRCRYRIIKTRLNWILFQWRTAVTKYRYYRHTEPTPEGQYFALIRAATQSQIKGHNLSGGGKWQLAAERTGHAWLAVGAAPVRREPQYIGDATCGPHMPHTGPCLGQGARKEGGSAERGSVLPVAVQLGATMQWLPKRRR